MFLRRLAPLLIFNLGFVASKDVIVTMQDSSLVWSVVEPNPRPTTCGGKGELKAPGESVSLTFSGVAFAVNLLGDWKGDSVDISLDGQVLQTLSTYATTSVYSVCVPITWNYGPFPDGTHTLKVTQKIVGTDYNVGNVFLSSFAYTPSGSTPAVTAGVSSTSAAVVQGSSTNVAASVAQTATTQSAGGGTSSNGNSNSNDTTTQSKSSNTGVIAGAAVGAVAVLAALALLWFCLRRRRRSQPRNDDSDQTRDLTTTGFGTEPTSAGQLLSPGWAKEGYAGARAGGVASPDALSSASASSPPPTATSTSGVPPELGYSTTPFVPPPRSPGPQPSAKAIEAGFALPAAAAAGASASTPQSRQPPYAQAVQQWQQQQQQIASTSTPPPAPQTTDAASTSARPTSISSSSMLSSVPMGSQLTPTQLETVRSLMSAGVTGNDLTMLVRSMVEGGDAGPSQPGSSSSPAPPDAPPPMYDFKDSSLR